MNVHFLRVLPAQGALHQLQDRAAALGDEEIEGLILQGHGTTDGQLCAGASAEILTDAFDCRLFWLYSCYCGLALAPDLAEMGKLSFGYVSSILTEEEGDRGVRLVMDSLSQASPSSSASEISGEVQARYLEAAINSLAESNVFQAAMLNHCRLLLREFAPGS